MVDEAKLHQFVGQMLSDLGGAASVALVRIGDALGLYKTLHERGAMTVEELAAAAGVNSAICANGCRTRPPLTTSLTTRRRRNSPCRRSRRWSLRSRTALSTCWAPLT